MDKVVEETPGRQEWSDWRPFPNPLQFGVLIAPFGPGCYELRKGKQLVLFGRGKNTALRMTSLHPKESGGKGTRNNGKKREYVFKHLGTVEYRTLACWSHEQAVVEEGRLRKHKQDYLFPT
jgi:hypothetical protein